MLLICLACINLILATRALPMPLNYPPGSAMTPSPAAGTFPLFWPSFLPVMPAFFLGISPPGTERTTIPTIYIKITNDNQQSEPSSQLSQQNSSSSVEPQRMNGEGGSPPSTSVLVHVEDSRTNRTASSQQYAAATAAPTTVRTEFVLPEPGTLSALPVPSPQATPLAVQPSSSETRSLIIPALPSAMEQQPVSALQTPTEAAALLAAAQQPVAAPQRSRKKASSSAGSSAEEQAALEQLFQTALLAEMLHQLQAAQNGAVGPHGGLPQSSANIQPA
ncbi:hypothetical protein SprV_0100086100 [Sparganum proliferum]